MKHKKALGLAVLFSSICALVASTVNESRVLNSYSSVKREVLPLTDGDPIKLDTPNPSFNNKTGVLSDLTPSASYNLALADESYVTINSTENGTFDLGLFNSNSLAGKTVKTITAVGDSTTIDSDPFTLDILVLKKNSTSLFDYCSISAEECSSLTPNEEYIFKDNAGELHSAVADGEGKIDYIYHEDLLGKNLISIREAYIEGVKYESEEYLIDIQIKTRTEYIEGYIQQTKENLDNLWLEHGELIAKYKAKAEEYLISDKPLPEIRNELSELRNEAVSEDSFLRVKDTTEALLSAKKKTGEVFEEINAIVDKYLTLLNSMTYGNNTEEEVKALITSCEADIDFYKFKVATLEKIAADTQNALDSIPSKSTRRKSIEALKEEYFALVNDKTDIDSVKSVYAEFKNKLQVILDDDGPVVFAYHYITIGVVSLFFLFFIIYTFAFKKHAFDQVKLVSMVIYTSALTILTILSNCSLCYIMSGVGLAVLVLSLVLTIIMHKKEVRKLKDEK